MKLTVVCREEGTYNVLIYSVDIRNPANRSEVQQAVQEAREIDLGDKAHEWMEILFAFQGDLAPRVDWRE